ITHQAQRPLSEPAPDSQVQSSLLCSSPISSSSLLTQRQAFKQPMTRPATSSASVQECLPGWRLSSQIPSAAPSSVGTTTDQPISPIMPKPSQTPCVDLRALSLRAAFAPICAAKVGSLFEVLFGSSFMLKSRKT